jgi:hypothetical protein
MASSVVSNFCRVTIRAFGGCFMNIKMNSLITAFARLTSRLARDQAPVLAAKGSSFLCVAGAAAANAQERVISKRHLASPTEPQRNTNMDWYKILPLQTDLLDLEGIH